MSKLIELSPELKKGGSLYVICQLKIKFSKDLNLNIYKLCTIRRDLKHYFSQIE